MDHYTHMQALDVAGDLEKLAPAGGTSGARQETGGRIRVMRARQNGLKS
jgi:hypothetical protein